MVGWENRILTIIKCTVAHECSLCKHFCQWRLDSHVILFLHAYGVPKHSLRVLFTSCMLLRYMKRRCHFLDNCPGFNFNNGIGEMVAGRKTNTKELGSILMRTMLSEVHNFCDPLVKFNWSRKAHQQVSPGFLRYPQCNKASSYNVFQVKIFWSVYNNYYR